MSRALGITPNENRVSRIVELADGRVSFRWKDYRHHDKSKLMTLDAFEFIRRFLLHSLPDGFHRIRCAESCWKPRP